MGDVRDGNTPVGVSTLVVVLCFHSISSIGIGLTEIVGVDRISSMVLAFTNVHRDLVFVKTLVVNKRGLIAQKEELSNKETIHFREILRGAFPLEKIWCRSHNQSRGDVSLNLSRRLIKKFKKC